MKRNKDRHQLAHSSSFRYQRPSSPYLVEDGESSSEHVGIHMTPFACPLEVNTSSSPVSPAFLKYPHDRSSSSCSNYRGSPYDLSVHSPETNLSITRRNSDPMADNYDHGVISPPLPMDMEDEYDQPLDMSKKSRILSSSSSSSSPPSESHIQHNHHHHHRHNSLHLHGSISSSSSSSTSSRANTCSPESIYKGNHVNGNSGKNLPPYKQHSMFHNQPHHLYQPPTINSPSNNMINHHNHIDSHNGNPHLQPRPSVITCASTLFGPRRSTSSSSSSSSSTSSNQHHPNQTICSNNTNGKDESIYSSYHNQHLHHHQINSGLTSSDKTLNTSSPRPSSLQSTSSSSSLSSFSSSSSCSSSFSRHHQQSSMKSQTVRLETVNDSFNKNGKKKLDGHSQLLIHGEDSDSGIDEHFRKSLGNHYPKYTNVSMSVDDHFAKALGDTWYKLKQESQNGSKGNNYNKANAATIPS